MVLNCCRKTVTHFLEAFAIHFCRRPLPLLFLSWGHQLLPTSLIVEARWCPGRPWFFWTTIRLSMVSSSVACAGSPEISLQGGFFLASQKQGGVSSCHTMVAQASLQMVFDFGTQIAEIPPTWMVARPAFVLKLGICPDIGELCPGARHRMDGQLGCRTHRQSACRKGD